jgi:NAD-dependent dihydropyrimidine dehydrogenase PreA subunit
MSDTYRALQEKLDTLSSGYPATESGVEIRILKKLFSEEDARTCVHMSPLLEEPSVIAARLDEDPEITAERLEDMAKRGLVFRHRKGETARYGAIPFVVGIFEFQLKRMDEEFAVMMDEYFDEAYGKSLQGYSTPVMRTIPVNEKIVHNWPVAPYEDVLTILKEQKNIVLADCVCRVLAHKNDRGCDNPVETCLIFGSHADYYVENGLGRYITNEEALEVAKKSEEAGLVMQPFNSQKAGGMCSCCGDCCGILRSIKMQPSPAKAVQSNYFAVVDEELCTLCSICVDRCQVDAISLEDAAVVDLNRCIGCGLCVTTCDPEAITLQRKPEDDLYVPPANGAENYIRLAQERGKNPLPE